MATHHEQGSRSSTGDRADDEQRLVAGGNGIWKRSIRLLVRKVLLAAVNPQVRPPALRGTVANGSREHRVPSLERIEDRLLRHRRLNVKLNLAGEVSEDAEMKR